MDATRNATGRHDLPFGRMPPSSRLCQKVDIVAKQPALISKIPRGGGADKQQELPP